MDCRLVIPVLLAIAACSCGGKDNGPEQDTATVNVTPAEITCTAAGEEVTLSVNASGAFQAFPADDAAEWISVTPSYSKDKTASIIVKIGENAAYRERKSYVTIKCGTTRKQVPVTQAAMQQGELNIDVPEGYHLVWREEFDKAGAPAEADWWYETGGGGWGNNEEQIYVNRTQSGEELAYISNGTLKIETKKIDGKVYSIRMNTRKYWTYGWFEAALKVSDVRGSWPAFWMMPQNFTIWPGDGEVDIMEYAISTQGKDYSSSSIHCNAFNWPKGTQKTHKQKVENAATKFHVYACEWTPEFMKFYVDGNLHLTFQNDGKGYDHWPFNAPFYLKLNQAWGGNMGGATDPDSLPAIYEIDYIRVFQKD